MSYLEFYRQHTELHGLDQATIDLAYSQYLESLDDAVEMMEE